MDPVVDKVRGTHCAYALELQGDDKRPFYVYCGCTSDIQTRMAQHAGGIPGGSKWTALHPPTRVLDVVPCHSLWHAACVEVALWGFYAGKLKDYDAVRGGKFCMCESLRYPPPGWPRGVPSSESTPLSSSSMHSCSRGVTSGESARANASDDFPLT